MRSTLGWVFVCLMACTTAGAPRDPEPTPATPPAATAETPSVATPEAPPAATPEPATATPTPAPAVSVTVQMTAATLADACGGPAKQTEQKAKMKMKQGARMRPSCDESSMQLSIAATTGDTATRIAVKKVELLDDKGALLGELTASTPTAWDQGGTYVPWDESVAPGQELSISYALSQPPWGKVSDRWNRSYLLRAVITVGSGEQSVQRDVHVAAPTTLPPNVKT